MKNKVIKRIFTLFLANILILALVGCNKPEESQSSAGVEVIIEEETIIQGDSSMTSQNSSVSSENTQQNSSKQVLSSDTTTTSSETSSAVRTVSETETTGTNYEWKSHAQDYKLLSFTFDDGPGDLMQQYVQYFAAFEGAGTFFVNGRSIDGDYEYTKMQNAIDYGWDIGNHGDQHLVATTGGAGGGEVSYDELKADIDNLNLKLKSNLKFRDGSPYEVALYRPPNIKPTANTFQICNENNLAVIWLAHDALDWGSNTREGSYNVFKNGIGAWKDGDIILCHETSQNTYEILEEVLPNYYKAGYRFCSITELMELRGITIDQISGELNEVDANRGMVTNIFDAAKAGKKS